MVVARGNLHPVDMETYCYCCHSYHRMGLYQHGVGLYVALCPSCVKEINSRNIDVFILRQEKKEAV